MNQSWVRAMEIEMQRQALISLLVLIVFFAVFMWVLYIVIKAAIPDGIREVGLLQMRRSPFTRAIRSNWPRHGASDAGDPCRAMSRQQPL